jgi:hypothetical protein
VSQESVLRYLLVNVGDELAYLASLSHALAEYAQNVQVRGGVVAFPLLITGLSFPRGRSVDATEPGAIGPPAIVDPHAAAHIRMKAWQSDRAARDREAVGVFSGDAWPMRVCPRRQFDGFVVRLENVGTRMLRSTEATEPCRQESSLRSLAVALFFYRSPPLKLGVHSEGGACCLQRWEQPQGGGVCALLAFPEQPKGEVVPALCFAQRCYW